MAYDRAFTEFGFTNDPQHIERVRAFVAAAVADGWSCVPTYAPHEGVERAAKLEKDGFKIQAIMREKTGERYRFEAKASAWGPDGLCINLPDVYDWQEIQRLTRICGYCHREVAATERVGFAGRCCADCLPDMRKKIEQPGWTN